jgi:hypothetical protein
MTRPDQPQPHQRSYRRKRTSPGHPVGLELAAPFTPDIFAPRRPFGAFKNATALYLSG